MQDQRIARDMLLGLGLLLLAGGFLAFRTQRTVSGVLRDRPRGAATASAPPRAERSQLARWEGRDSLVTGSALGPRDPFRAPPVARRDPAREVRRVSEVSLEVPVLRAVLYDAVRPAVQLSAGGETSEWLQQGDTFQGWRVVEILPASVTVSKDGKSVVLTSS